AFSILFYAYYGSLHSFIMKLTRSAEDTEEVIQETFLRLWLGRDKLLEVEAPPAWIHTVAVNECYKFLKKRSSRKDGLAGLRSAGQEQDGEETLHALQLKEVKQLVTEAVSRLPRRRRHIFQMSRDEGMTIPQIAAALRISPNTVKNTLVTSLRTIRDYLTAKGHGM
ncbi:MAG: sigma-70 family RNA polymerase sigma factor, partial [Bacteroidetes bacterium]|nr:sigma-70 family RNA polymerase sigma factor [Bacteroidota bacterium]